VVVVVVVMAMLAVMPMGVDDAGDAAKDAGYSTPDIYLQRQKAASGRRRLHCTMQHVRTCDVGREGGGGSSWAVIRPEPCGSCSFYIYLCVCVCMCVLIVFVVFFSFLFGRRRIDDVERSAVTRQIDIDRKGPSTVCT